MAFETRLETGRPKSGSSVPNSYGLIYEFWQSGVLVTMAAFNTGDVSVYFSNGGGILGGVQRENVAQLARKTMPLLGPLTPHLERSEEIDPPAKGEITFTILTDEGRYRSRLNQMPEQRREDVNFQLFALSQGLITEMRKAGGS